ncbi:hypothetical protein [Streptomyces sp. NPDC057250]|uniref:hypothetical protein n=1 Tax=Streptomyces sp. NPDC057250 TaxID=3346068 RepID=UPI003629E678
MTIAVAGNRHLLDFGDPVTEVFEFLHSIYGRRLPRITFIYSPNRLTDPETGKSKIQARFFRRARPTVTLIRELLELAEKPGHEIFFRVAPMDCDGLRTAKDNVLAVNVAWTEVDGHGLTAEELALLASINATVVESGGIAQDGGAKTHVYVPLDVPHQPHVIEGLSQALRNRLAGDKFDMTTFLRLPGSWHRKDPDNPVRVSVRRYSTKARVTLSELVSALGTDVESITAQSRVTSERETPTGALGALPKIPEGFNWRANVPGYAPMRKVKREWDGRFDDPYSNIQRYKAAGALVKEAIRRGLTVHDAYAFAMTCKPLLDKQAEENGYSIRKDVARIWRREAGTGDAPVAVPHQPERVSAGESDEPDSEPEPKSERDASREEEFWQARPVLTHIRDFAHSRLVSSWAVFGISVARVMNQIPTEVLLPPLVGGRTGLNFYVGIVDSSGVGKGASESAAEECFEAGNVLSVNIGSGEGIAHAYMSRRKATQEEIEEGKAGRGETVMEMHTQSVLFTAPEIDTLTAIKGRSSSTLSAELRKAWSGERLGFMYVTEAKRLTIEKHTYRMTLVCGVQPTRAEALLDESGGGLPQRFLWMPANDPNIPELEDLRGADAIPLKLPDFFHEVSASRSGVTIGVCESARREIRQHQHAKIKRTVTPDPLDSHRNLVRLKVAAALGFMDGRKDVSEEDWALADIVMGVSDRTRDFVRLEIGRARSDVSRERGRDDAIREVAKREHVETETTRRVWRRLDEVVRTADKPLTVSDLQKKVPPRDREGVPDVVAEMVAKGLVREAGTNRKGNATYERVG